MKYKMNEFGYIEKYFKPLTHEIGRDLKNDAAIFNQRSGYDLIISTDKISDAVSSAYKISKPGDIVLLSPACSSFDLFKDYEDRGNRFKEEVRKLWVWTEF